MASDDDKDPLIAVRLGGKLPRLLSSEQVRKVTANIVQALTLGVGQAGHRITSALDRGRSVADAKATADLAKYYAAAMAAVPEDQPQLRRLIDRQAADAFRRQSNREAVASGALAELPHIEPNALHAGSVGGDVDPDWLEIFWDCAERKSREEVRRIFAKVLAAETVKPGAISPATLHTLSILDQETARCLDKLGRFAVSIDGQFFLINTVHELDRYEGEQRLETSLDINDYGVLYEEEIRLESMGLISTMMTRQFDPETDEGEIITLGEDQYTMRFGDRFDEMNFNLMPFLAPANEILQIVRPEINKAYCRDLISACAGSKLVFEPA